jgi:hypothetical protein
VRKLPDDNYPRSRFEIETAGLGYVAAQVNGLLGEAGRARREVVDGDHRPEKVFDQAFIFERRGRYEDVVCSEDAGFRTVRCEHR